MPEPYQDLTRLGPMVLYMHPLTAHVPSYDVSRSTGEQRRAYRPSRHRAEESAAHSADEVSRWL